MELITIILIFILGYGVGATITLNIWLNEVNLMLERANRGICNE